MFACALYPGLQHFFNEVEKEIVYQVQRLKDHPSFALWFGNNENPGTFTWFEESKKNRDRYFIDYDRLNEELIGNLVRRLDTYHLFWLSSPSGGSQDFSDN